MSIIQVSVIKDACNPVYDGIDSLFTGTTGVVDRYVVGVDNSSIDGTREEARRVLRNIGKPFDLYGFSWPDNFSTAFNEAIDRAQQAGADWVLRLDADERFEDTSNLRRYVEGREREIIRAKCPVEEGGDVATPIVFRSNLRFDGVFYETLELMKNNSALTVHPILCRNFVLGPSLIKDFEINKKEKRRSFDRMKLLYSEAERLYKLIAQAKSGKEMFRLANRFYQLGMSPHSKAKEWAAMSQALYRDAMKTGYEPGDCFLNMSCTALMLGDDEAMFDYFKEAKRIMPDEVKRVTTGYEGDKELMDSFLSVFR